MNSTILFLAALAMSAFPNAKVQVLSHNQEMLGTIFTIDKTGKGETPTIKMCNDALMVKRKDGKYCILSPLATRCMVKINGGGEGWHVNGEGSYLIDEVGIDHWIACVKGKEPKL